MDTAKVKSYDKVSKQTVFGPDILFCAECNLHYMNSEEDIAEHKQHHNAYLKRKAENNK